MSKKFISRPRYEVLKFCPVSGDFWANFTLFSTIFAEWQFAAQRKVELAPKFFCLKADGKGLIIGFETFGFGPSKPELWHFSFVPKKGEFASLFATFRKNIGFEGFASL